LRQCGCPAGHLAGHQAAVRLPAQPQALRSSAAAGPELIVPPHRPPHGHPPSGEGHEQGGPLPLGDQLHHFEQERRKSTCFRVCCRCASICSCPGSCSSGRHSSIDQICCLHCSKCTGLFEISFFTLMQARYTAPSTTCSASCPAAGTSGHVQVLVCPLTHSRSTLQVLDSRVARTSPVLHNFSSQDSRPPSKLRLLRKAQLTALSSTRQQASHRFYPQ
jgi:hypothetical protein